MNLVNKINNVKAIVINNKELWYNSKNEVFNAKNEVVLKSDITLQTIKSDPPFLFVFDNDGNSYIINENINFYKDIFILGKFNSELIVETLLGTELFNLSKKSFHKILNDRIFKFKIKNNTIFYQKNTQILAYTLPTATPLWQFDLGSFGEYVNDWGEKFPYEVEQFIGVLGSNLLVLLNQKELLALDIHTGMIRQRLQYVDSLEGNSVLALDEKNKLKYYNTNYFVQDQNNIVYALFEDVLFEINAAQSTISTTAYGLKNEYDKYQINSYKVSSKTFYYDQKIYFLEQELGRFGILDLPTRSILYVSEPIAISGEGLGFDKLKEIQAAENKVYILDKTNTLHIFEKE